jgi:hypothetical protein
VPEPPDAPPLPVQHSKRWGCRGLLWSGGMESNHGGRRTLGIKQERSRRAAFVRPLALLTATVAQPSFSLPSSFFSLHSISISMPISISLSISTLFPFFLLRTGIRAVALVVVAVAASAQPDGRHGHPGARCILEHHARHADLRRSGAHGQHEQKTREHSITTMRAKKAWKKCFFVGKK